MIWSSSAGIICFGCKMVVEDETHLPCPASCPAALLAGLARPPRHRTRFSTKVYIKIVS